MKKHTDQTRLPYNYKLIFRTTLKIFSSSLIEKNKAEKEKGKLELSDE